MRILFLVHRADGLLVLVALDALFGNNSLVPVQDFGFAAESSQMRSMKSTTAGGSAARTSAPWPRWARPTPPSSPPVGPSIPIRARAGKARVSARTSRSRRTGRRREQGGAGSVKAPPKSEPRSAAATERTSPASGSVGAGRRARGPRRRIRRARCGIGRDDRLGRARDARPQPARTRGRLGRACPPLTSLVEYPGSARRRGRAPLRQHRRPRTEWSGNRRRIE